MNDKHLWGASNDPHSRMSRLKQRQRIISTIRDDLYDQGFLEVETPLLVKATTPDAHIESIATDDGYLVTSTEYQLKRMIVGGFDKVFTLTKNFRGRDRGQHHSTEFTMLEWARAHEPLAAIEADVERFIRKAFATLYPDQTTLKFCGDQIEILSNQWERISVREAFDRHLGLKELEDFSLQPLLKAAHKAGITLPDNFVAEEGLVMSYLLDLLQSRLGKKTPTFLCDWPLYLTASAPASNADPHVSERSELYIGGVEISNGFPFLNDTKMQRDLFELELEKREAEDLPSVKIDERFLEALRDLPPGAGMALGIDRLVMVLTGARSLADVQAFDWDEL